MTVEEAVKKFSCVTYQWIIRDHDTGERKCSSWDDDAKYRKYSGEEIRSGCIVLGDEPVMFLLV